MNVHLAKRFVMTVLLWLSGVAVAVTIGMLYYRPVGRNDLGSVSAQWLHEYRSDSQQHR
jgi:hypothetical protein